MRKINVVIISLLLTLKMLAQNENYDYLGLMVSFEYKNYSFEDINKYLSNNSYFPLSDFENFTPELTIGFIIKDHNHPKLSAQLLYHNILKKIIKHNSSAFNSNGLSLNFLYDILQKNNWELSPGIGITYNNNSLTVIDSNISSSLTSSFLEETLYQKNILGLKIGLNLNRIIIIHKMRMKIGLSPSVGSPFLV